MELSNAYFWDTYAFYRFVKGSDVYLNYAKNSFIVTTRLNLMELHYILLSDFGKEIADYYYDRFIDLTIDVDDMIVKKANGFKLAFKNRKFSYVDCIGYILAKVRGVRFLTGDSQFKDLDNVEFAND